MPLVGMAGRRALVTGAGRGIGRAIALRLAQEGTAVAVNDRDAEPAERVASELRAMGADAVALPADVVDPGPVEAMVAAAVARLGGLDIVVNNAGVVRDRALHNMTDADWDLVLDVVTRGAFNVCRAAAPALRGPTSEVSGHHRKVVNVSSVSGVYGRELSANYCTAKAGLIGLTKAMAREWAPRRVNVNAVAPGYIAGTRLTAPEDGEGHAGMDAEFRRQVVAQIPLGREGTPEDVAAVVAFLASAESDYITGQVVEVHGGLEILRIGQGHR